MFGNRYFNLRYFADRYFGTSAEEEAASADIYPPHYVQNDLVMLPLRAAKADNGAYARERKKTMIRNNNTLLLLYC